MRDLSQKGGSFLQAAEAVLGVVCACVVIAYWSSLLWHRKKISDVCTTMGEFFQKYQDGVADLIKEKAHIIAPASLRNYGLLEQCNEGASMFSNQKSVCKLPLGEFDVTADYKGSSFYTYVYVHFNDIYKRQSCKQFLSMGWQDILPSNFWGKDGYIGVISENTTGEIFFSSDSAPTENTADTRALRSAQAEAVCNVCKGSRYCSIQFFFDFSDGSAEVTFPSEFAGENEGEEGEGEVTKDGNTYTKTNGDFQEVVTYQDGGIFSGATFSGGALTSVYSGTYTPQGITSYQSYTDASKTNALHKINNIKYDKGGKVLSYEKDEQKFLLIDGSNDCLITDNTSDSKKLGNCEKPFQDNVSFVVLNYDKQGLLREVANGEDEGPLYTFLYDSKSGKLTGYCDMKTNECHQAKDGETIKDIVKKDLPDTIGKFNYMYTESTSNPEKPERKKYKVMTREEALKFVKEKDNKIKMKFR